MSPNAHSIPKTAVWNEYKRELDNAVDLMQNLSETPAQALSDVQRKMQAAVDRNQRLLSRRERSRN
jgi:maltose-binding protein MalE